jgi:hypothetical protein
MFRTACIFVALALCAATAPPRISLDLAGSDAHTALHGTTHSAVELNSHNNSDVDYSKSIPISSTGTDLPVAKAFDHVDQDVLVTTVVKLVDLNGVVVDEEIVNENAAHTAAAIRSTTDLNMGADNSADTTCIRASEQRSTYVFTYDAVDAAGNNAEQLTFVLELNDIVNPTVGTVCNDAILEAGNTETLQSQACSGLVETCAANSKKDTNTATDCVETLASTISTGDLTGDDAYAYHTAALTCQECHALSKDVTFTCTDTAGIYGSDNTKAGNSATRTIQLSCEDTTPPTVVAGNPNTDDSETFECKGASGTASTSSQTGAQCAAPIGSTPTFEELVVTWGATTTACADNTDIATNAVGSYTNCWTGSDAVEGCGKATNTHTVTRTYTVEDTTPPFFFFTNYAAGAQLDVFVTSHNIIDADAPGLGEADHADGQTQVEKSWSVITAAVDALLIRTDSDCCTTTPSLVGTGKWYSCSSETDCSTTESTETTDSDIPLAETSTNTEYWKREYTIEDDAGLTYTSSHVVHLLDKEIPIITVQECESHSYTDGHACITKVNSSLTGVYTDAGAKCSDFVDGSLSHAVEVSGDVVNLNQVTTTTFTIKYNCADLSGNAAAEATRTVNITDTTPPVIASVVDFTYEAGYTYTDTLPTVTDNMCADTSCIAATSSASDATTGDVDTNAPAVYTITYSATDLSGNVAAEVTRTVTIADTMAPVIVLSHPDTAAPYPAAADANDGFVHTRGSVSLTTANSVTDHGTQPLATDSTGRGVAASVIPTDPNSMWMPKDSFMAESTSVNGWFIGAIACAVTGVALLGLATRKVSTEVPV